MNLDAVEDDRHFVTKLDDDQIIMVTEMLSREIEREHGPEWLGGYADCSLCDTFMLFYRHYEDAGEQWKGQLDINASKWAALIERYPFMEEDEQETQAFALSVTMDKLKALAKAFPGPKPTPKTIAETLG